MKAAKKTHQSSFILRVKRQKFTLLMLAPAFLTVFLFSYVPLVGWSIAFTDYTVGKGIFEGSFTGLLQFKRFFYDSSDFLYLLKNTLVINVVSVVQNLFVALIFSILLNELRGKLLSQSVQTIVFFPYFVSWIIIYSLVWALFAVKTGAVNNTLVESGIIEKGINLLGDPKYSWGLMIELNLWKFTGYNSVIFLAAISGIPKEIYESAAIDGANRFQRIWYMTIPFLMPTLSILLIMNSGWIFTSNLDQFFVFYNATNWARMEVLDMYIYKFGLSLLDYPYATAVGILKTFISLAMLLIVNKSVKKLTGSGLL